MISIFSKWWPTVLWSKWRSARLSQAAKKWNKPCHIGFILDGNRRYAQKIGLKNLLRGHKIGADKLEEVLAWCREVEIPVISVWIFSIENFKREPEEVEHLMVLFQQKLKQLLKDPQLEEHQTRVQAMGQLDLLPKAVQDQLHALTRATAHHTKYVLNIGVAYSGRTEVVDATKSWLNFMHAKGLSLKEAVQTFSAESIAAHLYAHPLPDPDLIIRTSGEIRHSGFLLWQAAYAEYYFCNTLWPAFNKLNLLQALLSYHQRQRRYGQ